MNRVPVAGDVIRINGSRDQLVVESHLAELKEGKNIWHSNVFTTIGCPTEPKIDIVDPKEHQYFISGGMLVVGKEVDIKDIEFVEQITVKKTVSVTYSVSPYKKPRKTK